MSTIRMGGGPGGIVQGNYGTYVPSIVDGFYTVDVRDVPQLLSDGLTHLRAAGEFVTILAPRAASAGRIVASAALSSGSLTIANQPDVARQINVILGNQGSPALGTGSVSITYTASDSQSRTEVFTFGTVPQSGSVTLNLSRPAVQIATGIVSGIGGGTSPFVRVDDTNLLGLVSDNNGNGFHIDAEWDDSAKQASPGTLQTGCLGAVSVVTTPNGTHNFSFQYGFLAPLV